MIRLALVLALLASPAMAQTRCADRDHITKRLKEKYGERFAGAGMQDARSIFEIWVSDETGTWTIIMSRPNGQSCVMAAGENWRHIQAEPPGQEG